MRIIAGQFRSRRLKAVPGLDTRPTPDRLRETLFNVLASRIDGVAFIDAYAGTGAVGIEALSRGAARGIFIERSRGAVLVIRQNVAALGLRAEIVQGKVTSVLPRFSADILFLDPPYEREAEYAACLEIASSPLVIAQHATRFELKPRYGDLVRTRVLKQGDNSLSFFER